MDWIVEHRSGGAQDLHDADVDGGTRRVVVHEVLRPAVVLGSTQDPSVLDRSAVASAGVDVARRRSGGGAVLLVPGSHVWVDVFVPAGDPLWDHDVGHASWWLGEAWAGALGGGEVHRGGLTDRAAARVACFAAIGPGEVTRSGAKVLGISQRRTRHGARFQCVAYRAWDGQDLVGLLRLDDEDPDVGARVTDALLGATGSAVPAGWGVVEDLVPHLR